MANRITIKITELDGEQRTFEQACNTKDRDLSKVDINDRGFMELINSQTARHFGPNAAFFPTKATGRTLQGVVAHRAWGFKNVYREPTKVSITFA